MSHGWSASDAALGPRELHAVVRSYWDLSKPAITRMVLITTGLGVIAAPGSVRYTDLVPTVIGTGLVVAGANALNMFLERDSDRHMSRTKTRPLPSGRLLPDEALTFGVLVSVVGLMVLSSFVSGLAVGLAAFALLSYVLVYTPLKRVSSIALYVGAVPGALPPAIGYTAVTGSFDRLAASLFLILLIWQIPHFLAITLFRHEEYARAGLRVLPVERGLEHTRRATVAWALILLLTTLLPVALGLGSTAYFVTALASGLAFTAYSVRCLLSGETSVARKLFFSSMPHLVLVMATFVVSVL